MGAFTANTFCNVKRDLPISRRAGRRCPIPSQEAEVVGEAGLSFLGYKSENLSPRLGSPISSLCDPGGGAWARTRVGVVAAQVGRARWPLVRGVVVSNGRPKFTLLPLGFQAAGLSVAF